MAKKKKKSKPARVAKPVSIIGDRISTLAKKLFTLKKRRSDLQEKLTEVEKEITQISERDLAKMMLDAEVDKMSIRGRGTIYIEDVFYAYLLKENRGKFNEWLKKNGHGDLIKDYVFPATITAFAKDMVIKGEKLPDEIKTATVPTVRTRKA